ncbi:hypothetical protein V7087_00075 [Neobacillus niacini]|uniref:hypothetical protein n=1 Tax=Neobacillus niacini TaxID=86668 RepID=UPI002FFE5497
MSLIVLGWILLGVAVGTVLITFWDDIRNWLNQVAADAVERVFGYKARQAMHRAIAKVDRIMDKVRNTSTIYTKRDPLATHFVKTDIVAEDSVYEIDNRVLEEIQRKGSIVQEFEYKG